MKGILTIVLAILFTFTSFNAVSAGTYTITSDGGDASKIGDWNPKRRTLKLKFDLPSDTISIDASNGVTLDARGHTVNFVLATGTNVTIRRISSAAGITCNNVIGGRVSKNTSHGEGIWGIGLNDCEDVVVDRNSANGAKLSGISLFRSHNCLVVENSVSSNGTDYVVDSLGFGINLVGSSDNVISRNRVVGNYGDGISVKANECGYNCFVPSTNNVVSRNSVFGNAGTAIVADPGNIVEKNHTD